MEKLLSAIEQNNLREFVSALSELMSTPMSQTQIETPEDEIMMSAVMANKKMNPKTHQFIDGIRSYKLERGYITESQRNALKAMYKQAITT